MLIFAYNSDRRVYN